jgi:hypothetical protein
MRPTILFSWNDDNPPFSTTTIKSIRSRGHSPTELEIREEACRKNSYKTRGVEVWQKRNLLKCGTTHNTLGKYRIKAERKVNKMA